MTSITHLVLGLRFIDGWLVMIEEHFGKEIADRCEAYDEALIESHVAAQKFWYEIERPKVRKEMSDWLKEPEMVKAAEEARERRTKQLNETLDSAKQKLADSMRHLGNEDKKKEMLADIKQLERVMKSGITPEKIARAEEYPIERIITVNRGMAKCVNHEDSNPSMNCKRNFAYCHACGYHATSIGLYMKVNNVGFKEAVNTLSV